MLTSDGQHWPMMINIDQWWSMLKYKATKVISWNKFCTFIFFIFIGETKKTTIDQWLQHGIAQCMFWGIEQCLQQTIEQCSFCYFHQWSWRWSTLINIGKWRWWAVEQRPFLPEYISPELQESPYICCFGHSLTNGIMHQNSRDSVFKKMDPAVCIIGWVKSDNPVDHPFSF